MLSDRTQIHQIIMNLCTNATHAIQEESGALEIGLKNVDIDRSGASIYKNLEPGPYVCLSVSDTGYGMTPDTLMRIFAPYYSTKKKGEGTGLGLSMVHGIVENLNGIIKVKSEPGSVTTFGIYLPRIDQSSDTSDQSSVNIPGGKETILLIDDEEMVLNITRKILEYLGYHVIPRISSLEALKVFQIKPDRFDLVITDQTMPNMTGKKLAEKINEIRSDIPIILCTGFSITMTEEQALTMGIRAFIKKPILRKDLAAIVRRVLDENKEK